MRVPRAADMVAASLRTRVLEGELQDGDVLPPEAVLLEEFPVSRPTMREALRILETEGLIEIRRGKRGGCLVRQPRAETAAYHLGLVMQGERIDVRDLAAARSALEPACAALAAARPDRADVAAELMRLVDESEAVIEHEVEFTSSALQFHEALVRSAGNRTVGLVVGTLEAVWSLQERRWAQKAVAHGAYPSPDQRREVVDVHRRIAEHVASGDVDAASRAVRKHLEAAQRFAVDDPSALVEVVDRPRC
jgi:DNA-binding FadR family transcriptional regulator